MFLYKKILLFLAAVFYVLGSSIDISGGNVWAWGTLYSVGLTLLAIALFFEPRLSMRDETLNKSQMLVNEVLERLLNYCSDNGLNATFVQTPKGVALADVDDDTGAYNYLVDLAMPNQSQITEQNKEDFFNQMKSEIDAALAKNNAEKDTKNNSEEK